jgi:two-component system cell cycle sensor histidine kinase PleC
MDVNQAECRANRKVHLQAFLKPRELAWRPRAHAARRIGCKMNAEAFASPPGETGEAARMLRARLDSFAASLPSTMWLNPVWALLSSLPFTGLFPTFGAVPLPRIALLVALQILNSMIAVMLYRGYRADPSDQRRWLFYFTTFQGLVGTCWGFMAWLLWVHGDLGNHIMVALNIVCILWAYTVSRTIHLPVYFASVVPTALLAAFRFSLSVRGDAWGLEYAIAITFACTVIMALAVKAQLEAMLKTRFANEDLAAELRRAHDQALRKRFEAEAANASKTTFLANMSHELRTPLNAILGFSDIIAQERMGQVGVPRYREYANDIHTSGSHLLSIINDILDIAKIESGKMEIEPRTIDPMDALSQSVKVIAPRARERNQELTVDIEPDTPSPLADERALRQIVINLVSNAVKFTQTGGVIRVSCYRAADGRFELCVEDNGPGIAADLLERVFTPFNQIDNRYNRQAGGTGLGLSLVRGLAELHGGEAWIDSVPGKGVRAFVRLPVSHELPMARRASAA